MSRFQLLALLLGSVLIAYGLLGDQLVGTPSVEVDRTATTSPVAQDSAPNEPSGSRQRAAEPAARFSQSLEPADPRDEPKLILRLKLRDSEEPAAGATVELWRRATGEGTARRRERQLAFDRRASESGELELTAPAGQDFVLLARVPPNGPVERVDVSALAEREERRLTIALEAPPAPLTVSVEDAVSGAGIAGASLRARGARHEGIEDFPGDSTLLMRTDGEGRCKLPGEARRSSWLLVDAAGYGPSAVDPATVAADPVATVKLRVAAQLDLEVATAAGEVVAGAEVQVRFSLNGFVATRTTATDRRGRATLPRLPSGTSLEPSVTLEGASARRYATITLDPGETREFTLTVESTQGDPPSGTESIPESKTDSESGSESGTVR